MRGVTFRAKSENTASEKQDVLNENDWNGADETRDLNPKKNSWLLKNIFVSPIRWKLALIKKIKRLEAAVKNSLDKTFKLSGST